MLNILLFFPDFWIMWCTASDNFFLKSRTNGNYNFKSSIWSHDSTRSLFYSWTPQRQKRLMEKFPQLKSPLTATDVAFKVDNPSPFSDLLIPLFSGPGNDEERLKFAKVHLGSRQENGRHHCALIEDIRSHTSAFYTSAQQRKEMLKFILEHEKNW